ncbi:hypothetical protein [Phocaeicola coprocola]|uniref:hypothetical protein n=1 Tax=Phocaeicola coprocola TaxID=310298 RepID=UPI0026DB1963|nr:hypothetical protein [Phocaeicola coprocola]
MVVILLLLMLIIAFFGCIVRKEFRQSLIFAFPIIVIIGMYVWLFTLYPVQWGLKKLPFVEQACIREISASDYSNIKYRHLKYDGVIEFITDKKLDDRQNIVRGSYKRNLSYNDFITNDSLAILISYDVVFVKEMNDKFFYKALFISNKPNNNILCDSIYCKIFMIRMFAPIYETNEFAIQYNKLSNGK